MDTVTIIPPPGAHGGDGARIARALGRDPASMLDLSLSMNPVASDPLPTVLAHLDAIRRYPDPEFAHHALAASMGVDRSTLLLTNGGAEAISLLASEVGGHVVEPEFSLHPRGEGPLWRSNPHSPSGLLANHSDRADVWDEAFFPLATGRWTRGDQESMVVGSLTKLLSCPGLRVGYLLGDPKLIDACRKRQATWSLNALASAALPDLLATVDLPKFALELTALRATLREVLEQYGLRVLPSDANWLLVEQPGLRDALAMESIVVRDCTSFRMPDVARMAVPDYAGIERVRVALERIAPTLEQQRHTLR